MFKASQVRDGIFQWIDTIFFLSGPIFLYPNAPRPPSKDPYFAVNFNQFSSVKQDYVDFDEITGNREFIAEINYYKDEDFFVVLDKLRTSLFADVYRNILLSYGLAPIRTSNILNLTTLLSSRYEFRGLIEVTFRYQAAGIEDIPKIGQGEITEANVSKNYIY